MPVGPLNRSSRTFHVRNAIVCKKHNYSWLLFVAAFGVENMDYASGCTCPIRPFLAATIKSVSLGAFSSRDRRPASVRFELNPAISTTVRSNAHLICIMAIRDTRSAEKRRLPGGWSSCHSLVLLSGSNYTSLTCSQPVPTSPVMGPPTYLCYV